MKLMDQILRYGAAWPVPNSSSLPAAIDHKQIEVRYIIDEEVASICDNLVRHHFDMLVDMLDLARVPALSFWLERVSFDENNIGGRSRLGCSVSADETGRAGEIVLVTEMPGAVPIVLPQKVLFNFDGHNRSAEDERRFRPPIAPDADAAQNRIADVFEIELHRGWEKYYLLSQQDSALAQQVKAELSASVYDGLFVLAFCVLLSSQRSFREVRVDLDRLNRHRVTAGRHKLLDHVEVKASLFGRSSPVAAQSGGDAGRRSYPRTHVVRGHFVRKGTMLFWRRTHVRGSSSGKVLTRTVNVNA